MKTIKVWFVLVCLLAAGGAGLEARGKEQAEKGFDRLKALAGNWETKGPDGAPLKVTFTVTSNGTAVMEHMSYNDMITMYHRDGDQIMLTHYCGGNNQPRMKAPGLATDGKQSILDINPEKLHQRTPLVIGSKADVTFATETIGEA